MAEHKPKRFRLSFVNAAEDVPRLIRAYGRACDGEFALVLRPPEHRGVLVLVTKKEGARFWRGEDAPGVPEVAVTAAEALAMVRTEQKAVPKPGPITLRGQWSGYLHCEEGRPRVELVRKLAAYGVLRVESHAEGHWHWTVERTAKWFAHPGSDTGTAATLVGAVEAGLARAMGLLGEACSVRDSRRRAALDESYAAEHPVKPAKEGRDPTERIRVKALDAPVVLPDVPSTTEELTVMAEEVTAEAAALTESSEPDVLKRARRLIRYATVLTESEHCRGRERKQATDAIRRAEQAYDEARTTLDEGGDVARPVRQIGEQIALVAAKAARSCAAGQLALPAAPRSTKPRRQRSRPVAVEALDEAKDKALLDAFSAAVATAMQQA